MIQGKKMALLEVSSQFLDVGLDDHRRIWHSSDSMILEGFSNPVLCSCHCQDGEAETEDTRSRCQKSQYLAKTSTETGNVGKEGTAVAVQRRCTHRPWPDPSGISLS